MPHARLLPILLVGLLATYCSAAWSAVVTVHPVRVHLSDAQKSELLELRNNGVEAARFQVQAHAWHQRTDGEMQLSPTRDLLFFPSLFEIQPGETRRIRVASTAPPGGIERSYRLVLEEFPRAPEPGKVRILTRLSIPVFVQPKQPDPQPEVNASLHRGQLLVSVENGGNAYFRAQSVRVVARTEEGKVAHEQSLPAWYVLARNERHYAVNLPWQVCSSVTSLTATVQTEAGNASVSEEVNPATDCGR